MPDRLVAENAKQMPEECRVRLRDFLLQAAADLQKTKTSFRSTEVARVRAKLERLAKHL